MATDNDDEEEERCRGRGLMAAKTYYLITFSCTAFVAPYLNIYFKRLGFSEETIGILSAVRPWVSALSGSLWAAVADTAEGHRMMLLLMYVLSTATRGAVALVDSFWPLLLLVVATEAFNSPVCIIADTVIAAACDSYEGGNYGAQRMYGAIGWGSMSLIAGIIISHSDIYAGFWCYIVIAVFAIVPLIQLPMGALKRASPEATMQPRPTAAIAIAAATGDPAAAATAHFLRDQPAAAAAAAPPNGGGLAGEGGGGGSESIGGDDNNGEEESLALTPAALRLPVPPMIVEPALWVVQPTGAMEKVPLTVLEHANSLEAPLLTVSRDDLEAAMSGRAVTRRHGAPVVKPSVWAGAKMLLTNADAMIFFIMVTLMGFAKGVVDSFLFIFLDQLGGSETLMGWTLAAMCVAEVPIFFFTGRLLKRVGIDLVLHVVLGALVLRSLAYTVAPYFGGPYLAAPIEFVGGAVFSCAWAAGISNCTRISPPGLETTVQAIYQGLFTGVGAGLGALIGGAVYSRYNAQVMFAMAAAAVSVGWLFIGIGHCIFHRHRRGLRRDAGSSSEPLLVSAA